MKQIIFFFTTIFMFFFLITRAQEAADTLTTLPPEVLYNILEFIPGNNQFLNDLSRKIPLTPIIYLKMVKSYLNSNKIDFPDHDDVQKALANNFSFIKYNESNEQSFGFDQRYFHTQLKNAFFKLLGQYKTYIDAHENDEYSNFFIGNLFDSIPELESRSFEQELVQKEPEEIQALKNKTNMFKKILNLSIYYIQQEKMHELNLSKNNFFYNVIIDFIKEYINNHRLVPVYIIALFFIGLFNPYFLLRYSLSDIVNDGYKVKLAIICAVVGVSSVIVIAYFTKRFLEHKISDEQTGNMFNFLVDIEALRNNIDKELSIINQFSNIELINQT